MLRLCTVVLPRVWLYALCVCLCVVVCVFVGSCEVVLFCLERGCVALYAVVFML